ncbi:RNA-directed DNA polymerase, eukaryota [Tanacetum coccineum]|uniref:RNA-directed DNA polymerase, eukaryota n=1 Tax=Tanacetum coccineum TaxID=301880 RepID=A0ABQ4WZD3_9ASTR
MGEVMDLEECKDDCFARKRICIKTKQEDNILEKFKIIIKGKFFMLRAKELFVWSPVFKDITDVVYCSDDESVKGADVNNFDTSKQVNLEAESDVEGVSDTYFGEHDDNLGEANSWLDTSIPYPLGFTPEKENVSIDEQEPLDENLSSEIHDIGNEHKKEALSWRALLDHKEFTRFPMNCLSLNIEGLGSKAKKDCIRELNIKHKIPNKVKLLMISIYAPQSAIGKRSLWSYILSLITRWKGNCMVMGNFDEVRCLEDRMGSVFNLQGANEFNNFISNSGLVKVQLEGFSFTWSHPSATKMSKLDRFLMTEGLVSLFPYISGICLDRHLSDHRPILLREVVTDYGATPFRMYHS